MEIVAIIASIVSVIIGGFAIWLAVTFYKMSTKISESIREAAKDISSGVERLEKIFDKLYADTFGMMKETVSDMRRHLWPTETENGESPIEEAESKADERVDVLKKKMGKEISTILKKQQITNAKVTSLRSEMRGLLDRAITESRRAEIQASEEVVRKHIMRILQINKKREREITAGGIVEELSGIIPVSRIIREIRRMRDEKIISWVGKGLHSKSIITLC